MIQYIIVIILVLLLIDIIYENKRFKVEDYYIVNNKIPKSFHNSKFVVLADLHSNTFGKNNDVLMQKIKEISPDFIIVAGDMLVGDKKYNDTIAYTLLSKLAKEYKIYYGFGNHERRISKPGKHYHQEIFKYIRKLEHLGVEFLLNRTVDINRGNEKIKLSGLDMEYTYYARGRKVPFPKEYLKKNIGKIEKECYNILIGHNPIYFNEYASWGADLTLAGHVHGGLVRLFSKGMVSPQYRFFPKYHSGRYHIGDKFMLVSRGLGMHTIKIRVNNLPELMVVHLKCNDSEDSNV